MTEHTNTPKLRFPEFREGWESYKLNELRNTEDKYSFTGGPFGSDLKKSDYTTEGIQIIQLQNIGDGYFDNHNKIFTSYAKADSLKSCNIFPGDIIIAKMADPLARATILPNNNVGRYLMASDGIRLSVDTQNFDKKFVVEYINSKHFRKKAENNSTGSTRMRIGLGTLGKLTLEVPTTIEQRKIGDFFSKLDQQIELEEKKLELLEQQKRGYMQKIFSQELRFKDKKDDYYSDWKNYQLKDLTYYKNGKGYEKVATTNGKYNIINLNSIGVKGQLKDSGKYTNFEDDTLLKNDLIMILSDVAKGNLIGMTAIIDENNKYLLNQRIALLRIKNSLITNAYFLYLYINFNRKYFINMSTGMSQLNINKKTVEDFQVNLPNIEEQNKIAILFKNYEDNIKKQASKVKLLKQRKKGLLQKMFV
ncbi:restriction endonuclease subunit S [Staphylococcus epidermidis]|uniref:restriction endonuclease subunit S n=1 Tax=Staphylococcus epidermidis TaxID=1282 RepID=UPI0021D0C2BD|nr:restriction endonuclease subunit S [Staphylococcus epidermidis]UXR96621.1 restriction endonuclease subunit S [Staphylococcus epidermidis]